MKLSDFTDLQAAQDYNEVQGKMISPDMMVSFLTAHSLINNVLNGTTDGAKGLQLALQFGSEFNVITGHPSNILSIVDQMITDGILTQGFKDFCVSYANPIIYPFANATQSQFNSAKGLFASQDVIYTAGKDIIITLNADLSERVSATTWRVETGFEPENAGRSVFLESAQKYRINMSGKKSGNYEVRIPFTDADFTVELI